MEIVRTENLSKSFGRRIAVDNVSLSFEKGKIYGLLGPNGSGKSTYMKMIANLYHPKSGKMLYNNGPINVEAREHIAFMSTEVFFYKYMKISKIGEFFSDFYKDFNKEKYYNLLEYMQLDKDLKVESLSSGMASKLKIAATMAREAKFFMLDEPLNGIDVVAQDKIIETIITNASEDNTILLSSHLIGIMENILDEIIFIKNGKIVLNDNAENIRETKGMSIVDVYKEVYSID